MHQQKIRLKISKSSHGVDLHEGDIIKAVILTNGHARMLVNQNINIKPEEFDIIIPEDDFNKLLFLV